MRLTIRHITEYHYDTPVVQLAQLVRLCPISNAAQQVLRWQVRGNDNRQLVGVRDSFGNVVHMHVRRDPVRLVHIVAEGEVDTHNGVTALTAAHDLLPPAFFLAPTAYTLPDASLLELAEAARAPDGITSLHQLMQSVRDQLHYLVDSTIVTHTAAEALALGTGVCQDHAHVMISAARLLGFPARYVSGYLWTPESEEHVASHAWMEALLPNLGWVGFDAANRTCPDPRYVRLAVGRDYADAAPVRGMRRGGTCESMHVDVRVQAMGATQ